MIGMKWIKENYEGLAIAILMAALFFALVFLSKDN